MSYSSSDLKVSGFVIDNCKQVRLSWSEGLIEMGDKFLAELLKLCSAN